LLKCKDRALQYKKDQMANFLGSMTVKKDRLRTMMTLMTELIIQNNC